MKKRNLIGIGLLSISGAISIISSQTSAQLYMCQPDPTYKDTLKSKYETNIKKACKDKAGVIFTLFKSKLSDNTYTSNFYSALTTMKVRIGYTDSTNNIYVNVPNAIYSSNSDPDYNNFLPDKYAEFDCIEIAKSDIIEDINDKLGQGNITFASTNMGTKQTNLDFHDATEAGTFKDEIKTNGVYILRLYGAGGGGGGGIRNWCGGSTHGGVGGPGEIKTVAVLVHNDTLTLKYELGNGGNGGGRNKDNRCDGIKDGDKGADSKLNYFANNKQRNLTAKGGAGGGRAYCDGGWCGDRHNGDDKGNRNDAIGGHKDQRDRSCANATGDYTGKPKQWTCIPRNQGGKADSGNSGVGGGRGDFEVYKL